MQRILSFDLARGFTVLIMPSIHVVMLYSTIPVQQSLLGDILGFIAEGPGAQLFMLLMGATFTYSRRISKQYVLKRAFHLLVAAYLLNCFKFIIPLGLGLIPENLLSELNLKNDLVAVKFFLMIGDILHFAAIAYMLLFLVTRSRYYPYLSLALTIAIIFLSPYVWDRGTGNVFVDQLLTLFNGHPPQTFFPVFPWLVYPLAGLILGYLLNRNDQNFILKKCAIIGITLIVISCTFPATTTVNEWLPFYRTEPADTIFHLGFALLWLSIFHWVSQKIKFNPFFRLLSFCSRNITLIYLIQWVFICWCMTFTGYLQLTLWPTLTWMTVITLAILLLTYAITKSNAHGKNI